MTKRISHMRNTINVTSAPRVRGVCRRFENREIFNERFITTRFSEFANELNHFVHEFRRELKSGSDPGLAEALDKAGIVEKAVSFSKELYETIVSFRRPP